MFYLFGSFFYGGVQVQRLSNGLVFETRLKGDAWVTRAASVPHNLNGDLRAGDVIVAYLPTSERLQARFSVAAILQREIRAGQEKFSFAVLRDGSTWVASFGVSSGALKPTKSKERN